MRHLVLLFGLFSLTLLTSGSLRAAPAKGAKAPAKKPPKAKELAPFDVSQLPAPAPLATPAPTPTPTPPPTAQTNLPAFPAPLPPIEESRAQLPQGGSLPPAVVPPVVQTSEPVQPVLETEPPVEAPATVAPPQETPNSGTWTAVLNAAGVPARVAPNQKFSASLWAWNRGTIGWQTGSTGANRVRLVARWVDLSTRSRRKWNFFWLPSAIAPDGQMRRSFDLTAPPKAGRYYVIFGLVRLPANGEYSAPAYGASQEVWPNEFATVAYQVEVGS